MFLPSVRKVELLKASSHKIVKQSKTVADNRRRIGKVELGSTIPIDTDSLRSLRVYVYKIGDFLPILYELALTKYVPTVFENLPTQG